uniref:KIB1-4 beta-propeller domain-containing protein n=1 Tax=Aegilops tauschii TaxID=37682 RepID=R7W187_AEGTA
MSNENMDQFYAGTIRYYLVASGDRLLMVKQKREMLIWTKSLVFPDRFEVLEAVDLSSGHGRWREMNTLMGRALFLSEGCSESLPVTADQDFGPREDCIYFLSERRRILSEERAWKQAGLLKGDFESFFQELLVCVRREE